MRFPVRKTWFPVSKTQFPANLLKSKFRKSQSPVTKNAIPSQNKTWLSHMWTLELCVFLSWKESSALVTGGLFVCVGQSECVYWMLMFSSTSPLLRVHMNLSEGETNSLTCKFTLFFSPCFFFLTQETRWSWFGLRGPLDPVSNN